MRDAGAASAATLDGVHAWWRAANYLSAGQIYLLDNPLLREALAPAHLKPRLLGHWGTTPGLNFIYAHLNRAILAHDVSVLYVAGPGHGGPGLVANAWLEGTYSEVYPAIARDGEGMRRLFKQFSFPGGIPSHVAPETPGSIHEGGELGYSLAHAFGAAFDNPDLIVACVVGDGEAETGPLATSWHSNKFLNPVHDGAVLPILHLNGYKIAGPTVLARIPRAELAALMSGYGYEPFFVEGDDAPAMHRLMADTLDTVLARIRAIQQEARSAGFGGRPRWPMIVLRSPKGWTGPREVDGKPSEGSWRSHQVPIADMERAGHLDLLEQWLRSYAPAELFDEAGAPRPALRALAPAGTRRMSANPCANGGALLRELVLPDPAQFALSLAAPGALRAESTRVQGQYLREVMRANMHNFRLFSPDETTSNRWDAVLEVSQRCSVAEIVPGDEHIAADGRVMEMLSEHQCQGWLEGYLLSGRHGMFSCYEAFIHIVDSMLNQHAKWLKAANGIAWRRPVASLNYLLSSHVWRQDHNGASHQDPGFIDHVLNKKAEIVRVYLPPDANTLLAVTDHCLRSRNLINVIVAGKHPAEQWLDMDAAAAHCRRGIGVWEWAGSAGAQEPDAVLACAGDVPTLEALAAAQLLYQHFPALRLRVINVVDLMTLQPPHAHPHGLPDPEFDALFTADKPVVFAYHGYPALIHRLTYRRTNHANLHVHGFREEGTTTTPFDMTVLNGLDRFHLFAAIVERVAALAPLRASARQFVAARLDAHRRHIEQYGIDLPEILNWRWNGPGAGPDGAARAP
ncbi:phosphoketolase family protein [Massilia sp. CCM 9210]|uniref:phosphoketolase family protein n=1 Tax=Massilia scottii TaxID=3057166 RepID=UPI002796A388|nr:phosphoketolase family protein [Massilia sp. CCM 9210]MDQ1816387.1 phosphoketolase family protein [Massilia sp. CCM 9210]